MPRQKQNVDAFGKSWSPIDLPNLEKAVKLYERLNYLQDHFANSLSGSNKIMSQINEQAEIKEELQKLGIKHNEEELKQIIELIKRRQEENKVSNGGFNVTPQSTRLINRAQSITDNNGQTRMTMSNAGNFIANTAQQRYAQNKMNENLKYFQDIAKQMGRNPNSQLTSKLAENKTVNELSRSAGKFNFAADIIQVAANTFSKAVSTFSGLFFKGLNRQADTYERTFTNISVRTGTTRAQYFQNQTGTASDLYGRGLAGNVAVSEVQEMWNKLADIGMNQEQMFTRALDNVLTSKIVPYLDTTSTSFNILNERLDGKFVKDIRGINRLNNEIAGNNYLTSELLQELIDEMQPVSDAALEQLVQGSAEMTAMINKLTPKMGAEAAKSYVTQLYKTQKYSDQILNSGSLTEQKTLIDAIQNGINIYDPTQFNDFIALAGNNTGLFTNMGQGYTSTMNGLVQNVIGSATGETYARMRGYNNLTGSGLTFNALKESTDLTPEDIKKAAEEATGDYTNNVNNTLKQIQENELENASTWLAAIYEQIGYWGDVLAVLLKGLGAVLGAKLIGGIGKSILGIGGKSGGVGIGAALTKFAGTGVGYNLMGSGAALGINNVAAATAAGAAGVAAGGVMAVKGGIDVYNDFANNKVSGKTALSGAGAVAGVAGAGLLLASNPVGWAVLAGGAIAMIARSIWEATEEYNKSMLPAMEKYTKKIEEEMNVKKAQQQQTYNDISILQAKLKKVTDVEDAKRLVIEAGIATEEDLQDAKYDNIKSLQDLTDAYLIAKKDFDRTSNEIEQELKTSDATDRSKYADASKSTFSYIQNTFGNKAYADLNNDEREVVVKTLEAVYDDIKTNNKYDQLSDNEKKIYDKMKQYTSDFEKGTLLHNWDAIDSIIDEIGWHKTEFNTMIEDMAYSGDILENRFSGQDAAGARRNMGISDDDIYITRDINAASVALDRARQSGITDEAAQSYLNEFKRATLYYDLEDVPEKTRKIIKGIMEEHNISKYRSGLSYVPYDDYPALLHEGEAVITAATANELRNLVDAYRESNNENINFEAAIQNQTTVLVNKLNEVISTIEQINSPFGSSSSIVSEMSKSMSMLDNMKYMRSTKSFN